MQCCDNIGTKLFLQRFQLTAPRFHAWLTSNSFHTKSINDWKNCNMMVQTGRVHCLLFLRAVVSRGFFDDSLKPKQHNILWGDLRPLRLHPLFATQWQRFTTSESSEITLTQLHILLRLQLSHLHQLRYYIRENNEQINENWKLINFITKSFNLYTLVDGWATYWIVISPIEMYFLLILGDYHLYSTKSSDQHHPD